MTTDILDQLDRLTSPEAAKEAEQARGRSNFRPVWTECTCDIASLEGPYQTRLNNGTEVTRIALKLVNMHSIQGVTPFLGSDYDLELPLPANPNPNAEVVLTVASAQAINPAIKSVRDLVGLKGVHLKEVIHEFQGRKNTGTKDAQGKDIWADATLTTRYYKVESIGSGGSVAPAAVSDERLAEALDVVDGLNHGEAMGALGEDASQVLSKLILTNRIKQVDGVYRVVVPF